MVCQVIDELAVLAILIGERLLQLEDGCVNGLGAMALKDTLDHLRRGRAGSESQHWRLQFLGRHWPDFRQAFWRAQPIGRDNALNEVG